MRPDRLARLHAAVDRQAGERVRVLPYLRGNVFAGDPDPGRPVVDLVAVVNEVPKVTRTLGPGNTTGRNAELRLGSHTVKFTTSALPYKLASTDRVVLLDRGDALLKVYGVDPFGTDRSVARLEPLSQVPS